MIWSLLLERAASCVYYCINLRTYFDVNDARVLVDNTGCYAIRRQRASIMSLEQELSAVFPICVCDNNSQEENLSIQSRSY